MLREEAWAAFQDLREEAKYLPEMSLDKINAEIQAARTEKGVSEINASLQALYEAQVAFTGAAEVLGIKDDDDVQALVNEVRYGKL
ncbi:MAG: hypothetical protein IJR35_03120 [Synergistaceae bacterium]|nr:hypothetical protein [Synergistaceae bacterium]MBQ9594832.1 hypothetical protein [Synergistaceae bacterium]